MKINILGVKIDNLDFKNTSQQIAGFLSGPKSYFVVTPNPEIILFAHKHPKYRQIINNADLSLPDGVGLKFVGKMLGKKITERVSGADIVPEICRLAREKNQAIALLGGRDQQTVEKAAEVMRSWGNRVVFSKHGVPKEHWNDTAFHEKIVHEIAVAAPKIVFVALGHPKQEEWINTYREFITSGVLFIGCGGALDFIAGVIPRAPVWIQKISLEWLWRLIKEPKRYRRIINAVIIFPLTALYESIWKK